MLGNPDLEEIVYGERGMIQGIRTCMERQCLVSAITLIYSALDALSALSRPKNQKDTDPQIFKDWVDNFLHPKQRLRCTSDDIYGARCGILHTYSPQSRLSRTGNARAIVYRWRIDPGLEWHAKAEIPKGALVLCVEDLFDALQSATQSFQMAIGSDPSLREKVTYHLKELLCYRPWTPIQILVPSEESVTR